MHLLIQVELSKSELEKLQKQNQSVQLDVTQVREGVTEEGCGGGSGWIKDGCISVDRSDKRLKL